MEHFSLVSPSTSELVEDESLYSLSTATASSTSTFAGPGSLAGKAIQNFGKLTLKGVEQILISRRLSSIAMHLSHRNSTHIVGLPEMYSDLLELSRIHMYSNYTRTRALKLIIGQIASRYTEHLIQALLAWPGVEVNLLLSEILTCLDPIRTSRSLGRFSENGLISAYQQNLSQWEDHPLAPAVDFLRDFASSGEEIWPTVISCGSLDLLLHSYLSDFETPVAFNHTSFKKSSISATCASFLVEALADEHAHQMIQTHAIRRLWPLWPMLGFETVYGSPSRSTLRSQTWQTLEKRHIQWRISSIFDMLVTDWIKPRSVRMTNTRLYVDYILFDKLVDLLEFSGSSMLDEDTCFRALRSLHRFLTRLELDEVRAGLAMYTKQTHPDHAREIFLQIIRRIILLSTRAPESDSFFKFCNSNCLPESCALDPDASVHFIHCFFKASKYNERLRLWLIEGDIARLLDSTEIRLLSRRAWDGYGYIQDSASTQYITGGTTYHARVITLAWRMFKLSSDDERAQNYANEADLRIPLADHDDWEDDQMDNSALHSMRQIHKDRVYSWID